jgi:hypothetical protein
MSDPDQAPDHPRKGPFFALILIIALVVGGVWLQRHMRANGLMEDCLLAGRRNCDAAAH